MNALARWLALVLLALALVVLALVVVIWGGKLAARKR